MTTADQYSLEILEKVMGELFVRERVVLNHQPLDPDAVGLSFDVGSWLEEHFEKAAAAQSDARSSSAIIHAGQSCRPDRVAAHARSFNDSIAPIQS